MNSEAALNTPEIGRFDTTKLLCAFFMLLKATNNLLYLAVMAVLLDKAGANALPWVYLFVNIIFIVIQFRFMTAIAGREGHWLLSFLNWPSALLSFVAALIFPLEIVPLLIGFFILTMLIDLTSNQAFTAMLNHFISVSESRRVLPLIYASGSFGFILSGLLLKFVLDFVGIKGLLLMNGLIVLLAAIVLKMLAPVEELRQREQATHDKQNDAQAPDVRIVPSMRHPLASLLNISSFIIIFNKYLVDFLFAASLSSYFKVSNDLAAFLGVFGATADFAVIGLQTFIMHRVFARFPIGRILMAVPLVLTLLCGLTAFSLKFLLVATVQFLVLLNSKNFTVPATTIFMGVIPQRDRVYYRRDLSIACSISSAVVGGFLLFARTSLSYDHLFFIAAFFYLLLALVHAKLDEAYLKTLRNALIKTTGIDSDTPMASLQYVQLSERLEQLQQLLADEDPTMRLRAVESASLLPEKYAFNLLEPLLTSETDPRCLNAVAKALLTIAPEMSSRRILALIDETEDNRLRSDIIEAVGRMQTGIVTEADLAVYLDHSHHRVVASSIISLIRLTRRRETIEKAISRLIAMISSPVDLMRASGAAVMGELGLPMFVPALECLAAEQNQIVALNSAAALARIQTPAAMAALEKMLLHGDEKVSQKAEELLAMASKDSISRVSRLLSGITAEERKKLSSRLRAGARQESMELLAAILSVENPEKRRRLVGILEKADAETQLLISRCVIQLSETSTELSVAPLLARVRQEYHDFLPSWTHLLGAIAEGSIEKPDENNHILKPLHGFLNILWGDLFVINEEERSADIRLLWQKYCLSQIRFVAFFSFEPAAILKSFEDIAGGNSHEKGMALEYLETRVGKTLAGKIVPLIDTAMRLPRNFTDFTAFAAERGVSFDASLLPVSRQHLQKMNLLPTEKTP